MRRHRERERERERRVQIYNFFQTHFKGKCSFQHYHNLLMKPSRKFTIWPASLVTGLLVYLHLLFAKKKFLHKLSSLLQTFNISNLWSKFDVHYPQKVYQKVRPVTMEYLHYQANLVCGILQFKYARVLRLIWNCTIWITLK